MSESEAAQRFLRKLNEWQQEIKQKDEELLAAKPPDQSNLPPIRGHGKTTQLINLKDEMKQKKALEAKEKGNEHFKKGEYQTAIKYYSESIALDPKNAFLPANRAMAHLRLNNYAEALTDCDIAIKLDPKFVKAYHRRGTARKHLGMLDAALEDLQKALQLEPNNKEIGKDLELLQNQKAHQLKNTIQQKSVPTKHPEPNTVPPVKPPEPNTVPSVKPPETNTAQKPPMLVPSKKDTSRKKKEEQYTPPTTIHLKPKIPTDPPKSAYEFETVWNNLRNDLSSLYEYFKIINANNLPTLFKDAMSSDIFDSLLAVIEHHFLPENPKGAFEMLAGLFEVNRMSTILMFLSQEEKQVLQSIFTHLSETYSEEQLSVLKRKCRL